MITEAELERIRATPSGKIYAAAKTRRNGREYTGGAVCWDPTAECESVYRDCPRVVALPKASA